MSLIAELQRRKVFKVGAAYLVAAWVAIQAASIGFPAFDAPPWVLRVFILVVLLGFPIAVVMAWVFEVTPDGVKLDANATDSKRVVAAAALLVVLAVGWYFYGQPAFRKSDVALRANDAASATQAVAPAKSVAVLPFLNLSADPNQEFFSEGIAEELLNRLAQFPDLKVAARTSAFQFKGRNLDIADIGRKLNVSHVLEGSVRKQGNRLRITAQLIDSSSGFHLWSETYERDATDVFRVQDEIAAAIADALEAKISGRSMQGKPARQANPEAYDDYLQGRELIDKRVDDNSRLAVEAFDRAIAKDPTYSPAHSARAFALTIGTFWGGWLSREQAYAQARASIDEALRLDPDNAEAYMVRGIIGSTSLRIAEGRADLDRALALAPGNVDVINFYGDMLEFTGDMRGAERMKRKAMALDTLAFIHPINLGQILASQGRLAESLQYTQRGVSLSVATGGRTVYNNLLLAQLRLGRLADAQRTFDESCNAGIPDQRGRCPAMRIYLLAAQGHVAEAENEMAEIAAMVHAGKPLSMAGMQGPIGLAALYAIALHDPHRSAAEIRGSLDHLQWFGYNYLLGTSEGQKLPEEISTDPAWLAAWNDPRMKEWMDAYRANLAKFRRGQ
jgi:TolB-like protein/Tfp pilus assembly protein PilF